MQDGETFYENVREGYMFQVVAGQEQRMKPTPEMFYKFRTDVMEFVEVDEPEESAFPSD